MQCEPSSGEDDTFQTFWFNGAIVKTISACLQILTMYWTYGRKITQRCAIWLWFQCCNLSQRPGIWTVWKRIFFKVAIRICFMKSGSLAGCWTPSTHPDLDKLAQKCLVKFTTTFSQCTIKNRVFRLSCLCPLEILYVFGWEVKH